MNMMAVELFVYLYAVAFGVSAVIAVVLLVAAARAIGREELAKNPKIGS